jgi:F-type H+-transporting ATPase subunit a
LLGIPEQFQSVVISAVVMSAILLLGLRARFALAAEGAITPDSTLSARNIFELLVESVSGLAHTVIGHHSERYVAILATFFLFILTSNLLGLVPGFIPPTSDFDITFGLGVCSFLIFVYYGFKEQGMGFLAHLAGPFWWLAWLIFPLELIGVLVRPFSLGLRLFGNLFGDHLVLEIFTGLTKVGIPVVFYMLGTLVSVIQAFVFMLLSMIYIALSVSHHD